MAFMDMRVKKGTYRIDREEEERKVEMQYEISRLKSMGTQMNSLKCRGKRRKRGKRGERGKKPKMAGEKKGGSRGKGRKKMPNVRYRYEGIRS